MSKNLSCFSDEELKNMYQRPSDLLAEPSSNFPLSYYEYFLQEIKRLKIKVITFDEIFEKSSDWDYENNYPKEYKKWNKSKDKDAIYLVIQHDIDNHPYFTQRMVAMEEIYGIKSNVFLFTERYTSNGPDKNYVINHDFFKMAENSGFVIGYHQNALAMSGFDLFLAEERYRQDVKKLREIYDINFVVPHGGAGTKIDDKPVYNVDVKMPKDFKGNLRWVFNRYGAKFDKKWSDGGLGKTRDIKRIQSFDLVDGFLHSLKKGTRNFCLVHPQRWGFNVDTEINPLLAEQKWYQEICKNN